MPMRDPADLIEALWWRIGADTLAALSGDDSQFFDLSAADLLEEYDAWRCRYPELTAGIVYAGRCADMRRTGS